MKFILTIQSVFRATIVGLLAGTLGIVIPVSAAQQPGVPASSVPIAISPLHGLAGIAALPRTAAQDQQQSTTPTTTGAAPAKHRLPAWAWVAIVAGAGVAIGVGVLAGNSQSGKTSPPSSTATVGAGGTITAGAP